MRHENEITTLGEIINHMAEHDNSGQMWFEVMDVEIPGLDAASEKARETDDWDEAERIEAEYIKEHERCQVTVMWPQHVTTPRYNSDASYHIDINS